MLYKLDNNEDKLFSIDGMEFFIANVNQIEEIFNLYFERVNWFKKNNIHQWVKYLEHYNKDKFNDIIKSGNYFIIKKDNSIIAGFELSKDSKYWEDKNTNAIYIYKLVVKVGYKNIGKYIFDYIKEIAKLNNIDILRLDCLKTNKKLNDIYENYGFKLIKNGYAQGYGEYSLRENKLV